MLCYITHTEIYLSKSYSPFLTVCHQVPAVPSPWLNYLLVLTPWNIVLLEDLTGSQLVKKSPVLYGTWRIITAFVTARQLPLSGTRPTSPCTPKALAEDSRHIVLPSRPGSPKWSVSTRFLHQNLVYISPLRPSYSSRFDPTCNFDEEYRSVSFSLCSFLHSLVTSSFLSPNIPLSTLFLNNLSLRSSFNVGDQVSHPYKKQAKL